MQALQQYFKAILHPGPGVVLFAPENHRRRPVGPVPGIQIDADYVAKNHLRAGTTTTVTVMENRDFEPTH